MGNRFLNCLTAVFMAVLRTLLFVLCLIRALSTVWYLWLQYKHESRDLDNPDFRFTGYRFYTMEVCLVVLCTMGAYAAYSKNSRCLKLFALLASIYSLQYFAMGATEVSLVEWRGRNFYFNRQMISYAKNYQWERAANETALNKGTRAWNLLQSRHMCCGLNGPSDWTTGPLRKGGDRLPRSCCLYSSKCTIHSAHDLFDEGCLKTLDYHLVTKFAHVLMNCFACLLFGIAALFLASTSNGKPTTVAQGSLTAGVVSFVPKRSQYKNNLKQPLVAPSSNLNPAKDSSSVVYVSS